jgi:hypothetical protein
MRGLPTPRLALGLLGPFRRRALPGGDPGAPDLASARAAAAAAGGGLPKLAEAGRASTRTGGSAGRVMPFQSKKLAAEGLGGLCGGGSGEAPDLAPRQSKSEASPAA